MPEIKRTKPSEDKSRQLIQDLELKNRALASYIEELEKFKTLAETSYSWEFWQSPEGALHYISPSCERITGYPAQAFIDDPDLLIKIVHPRDVSEYLTHHLHVKSKINHESVRFRINTLAGDTKYIEHFCIALYDSVGKFLGTRVSNREIDVRSYPVEALTENEKKYRNLFRVMAQGVIYFDRHGIINEVNPSAAKILSLPAEEMHGRSLGDLPWIILNDKEQELQQNDLPVSIALETGRKASGILGLKNTDQQKIIWINTVATPVLDDSGKNIGVFATFDDISSQREQQSAQEALNREVISHSQDLEMKIRDRIVEIVQLSNLNQAIVNSLNLALITFSEDGVVTGFNKEAELLLGYKAEEVVEKVSADMFHRKAELTDTAGSLSSETGLEVKPDFTLFRTICDHYSGKPQEWTYVRKNGSEVPVLLSLSHLKDQEGRFTGYLGVVFDNSLRKATEELLRWNEHLLHLMSDSSPFGFLVTERDSGKVLYFNHRFCDIWNFDNSEELMKTGAMDYNSIANSITLLIKDSESISVLNASLANFDGNDFIRNEVMLKDGRTIGIFLTQISSEHDAYHGHFYIFEDITERKLTEKKLQLQNAAFESVALAVVITDINGNIMWVNPAFTGLTGYPVEEAIGQHTRLLKSGMMTAEFYSTMWKTILAGDVWTSEIINRKKDGSLYYEVETITPIFDDKGKVGRFISVKIDISNRIEMESALRVSEARWQTALEGSGYGIWDYNIITGEVFFSARYKNMLGYDDDEDWRSMDEWSNRIHPDDLKKCMDSLNSHFKGESEFYTSEYRMRCRNGSYKWIHDSGKVIEWYEKDKPFRVIGTHIDIDDRKRLETSLKESIEREKELNEMKSRFVSTASHEFRTPLSSILITSDSLLTYWERMENTQIKDKLNKINNQVLHLTKIVNDVLQLSKIEEGKVEFNPVDIDIIELCKQVIDSFNSDPKIQNKVNLITPFSSVVMKLDSRLIFQVINNLVSNGIKYTHDNPNIRVEVARKNNELCITVSDNGIGIPEPDQKHLFKPFYRASNTTLIQGNGLGLSIVKESIVLHGGHITFKSKLGHGTSFFITFPDSLIKSYE